MDKQVFNSVWEALYPESSTYVSYMEFKSALLKEAQDLAHRLPEEAGREIGGEAWHSIIEGEIDRLTVDDLLLILERAGSHYEVTFRRKAA